MLYIKKARWKNFLSFGNIFTEFDFNESTTIISGPNGAAKSSILDIITFGLYGKSYRQVPKPLLVNTVNKKDLLVEIEFQSYNATYLVRRGIKPSIFEYYKNGILVEQDSRIKDYQKQFEQEVLKISYDIFTQLVIVGKSNYTQFMKLTTGLRRSLIEQLLDLNVFSNMKDILYKKLSDINLILKDLDYKKINLENSIRLTRSYIETESNKNLQTEEQFSTELLEYSKRYDEVNENTKLLRDSNLTLLFNVKDGQELSDSKNKISKLAIQIDIKRQQLKKEIDFYRNNSVCPSCSQSIIDVKQSKLPLLDSKEINLVSAYNELKVKLQECETRLFDNDQVLKTIQKNELTISKNVAILTEIKLNIESLSKRKNSIHESNAESLLQLKTSLKQYQMELDSLESQYTEHLALKHLYEKIEPVLKDSGIKSLLIRKYIPIFNKLINHYLARLGLFVRFELDEEFNEKILSRNFDSFVYNSFSEGQRQRIDLAILLTWREITKLKNSIDCNLLIFDETLDASLDQSGVDSFIDIINEIEGLNIVVISHTPQKLQSFKRHFIYKLLGNFSQISKLEN